MDVKVVTGSSEKMDLSVTVQKGGVLAGEPEIVINSPVRSLFGNAQDNAVSSVLADFQSLGGVKIVIDDNQALDFVIRARLRAALEFYCRQEA